MIAGIRIKLKLAKDGKKWDRNRNNFDSVASLLKLLAVAHLLSPQLAGTGNCLPQESEQGSGRVGVLLYHLACCWFDNCLRQKNNFFITHQLHQTSYLLAIDKEDKTARKSQFWVVEGRLIWYWRHPSTLKKKIICELFSTCGVLCFISVT